MLKGDVFAEQLFENQIFALFINTFLDGNNGVASNYKNSMALSYSGANITIDSGAVCVQGRFMEENTSTTISVSDTNQFHKLIIEIDLDKTNTASSLEQAYYKILTSASAYPSLTQTDIVKNVSGIYQYELAQFKTDSSGNITNWTDKRTFLDLDSIYTAITNATNTLLSNINTNANTLITQLQEEIADVEDTSAFVMKNTIVTLEKSVTPAENGDVLAQFNYPSGFTYSNTIILQCLDNQNTGGIGIYRRNVDNGVALTDVNISISFNDSDCDSVILKIMRV